ncbi:MAG: hypothetical protein LBR45_02050, partial [Bacteroidales bacterium]|nr:hypothetical protein [Bacteroidales bacterium]
MTKNTARIFLYVGLSILAAAFILRYSIALPPHCFWIMFGVAISCKTVFLIAVLRSKSVKVGLWLYLILAGVAMILVSMLFKNIFPLPVVRNILFYG